jgi:hypothetical protein
MTSGIVLEFPEFITHIPVNKKEFLKIGYNKIHASMHFATRAALIKAMHGYIEDHINDNLTIQGPIETRLVVYAPINFGNVKLITDKKTGKKRISWNLADKEYKPNWDIGNLAMIWLKCLDDVMIKKGILPDDTVEHLRKTSYEFVPITHLKDRKLVYYLKTIRKRR